MFYQALFRDDGRVLGYVVHYYEDGSTYARRHAVVGCRLSPATERRIGACSTDQAARSAVEQALGILRRRCGQHCPGPVAP